MRKFHLFLIIVAVAAAVLGGCSGGQTARRLDSAEALMQDSPDSALAVLRTVDTTAMRRAVRARYALLLSQAYDKNYIDLTSDSLISIASSYYASHGDKRSRMLSLYYHARVCFNARNLPEAMTFSLEAFELARELKDDFWIAMTAREISNIYNESFNGADELRYARIEEKHFRKFGKPPYTYYGSLDLARSLNNATFYDKALNVLTPLCDTAKSISDTLLLNEARRTMGTSYMGKLDYKSACKIYESILESGASETVDLGRLGVSLVHTKRLDEAARLLDKLTGTDTLHIRTFKYDYYAATGQPEKAIIYLKSMDSASNAIVKNRITQDLSSSIVRYYDGKRLLYQKSLRLERLMFWLVTVSSVLIILVIVMLAIFIHKRNSARLKKAHETAQEINRMLDTQHTQEQQIFRETTRSLLTERFSEMNSLLSLKSDSADDKKTADKISQVVSSLSDKLTTDDKYLNELEELIDKSCSGYMSRIKKELPNLTLAEERLLVFRKLGFSAKAISVLLKKKSVESVYSMRQRIRDKAKLLPEDKREILLREI